MRRHSLLISSLLDSAPSAHDDPAHSDRVPKIFQVEFVIHAHVGTCLLDERVPLLARLVL